MMNSVSFVHEFFFSIQANVKYIESELGAMDPQRLLKLKVRSGHKREGSFH